jgi:Trk K+ transport system NAD-binding subunit
MAIEIIEFTTIRIKKTDKAEIDEMAEPREKLDETITRIIKYAKAFKILEKEEEKVEIIKGDSKPPFSSSGLID